MFSASFLLAALSSSALLVSGAPILEKRIAQVIAQATADWEQACLRAGGGQACNPLSVSSMATLLAAPPPCAQQDAADSMIDLARQLGNDAEMIRLAQLFRQQPRNAPDSVSSLYCQQAPRNNELQGLFQCQFQGVNDNVFTGGVALGAPGTIPLGLGSLNPLGSCPANPGGKIADGQQLNKLVNNPGRGNGGGGGNNAPAQPAPAPAQPAPAAPAPAAPAPPVNNNAGGFQAQNARDAQGLNQKFKNLNVGAACTVGEVACLSNGQFAQCPNGAFVATPCAGGTQCIALPLVNKAGTSVTCTTLDDAARRFAAAGVSGGFDGQQGGGNGGQNQNQNQNQNQQAPQPAPAPAPAPPAAAPAPAPAPAPAAGGFQAQNARDAQGLNQKFKSINVGSPCTVGDNACTSDGQFAQCPNGTFVATPCAGGTQCLALPLVNKAGTSVTCTTLDDAARRFAAAGVSGGFDGRQ